MQCLDIQGLIQKRGRCGRGVRFDLGKNTERERVALPGEDEGNRAAVAEIPKKVEETDPERRAEDLRRDIADMNVEQDKALEAGDAEEIVFWQDVIDSAMEELRGLVARGY